MRTRNFSLNVIGGEVKDFSLKVVIGKERKNTAGVGIAEKVCMRC